VSGQIFTKIYQLSLVSGQILPKYINYHWCLVRSYQNLKLKQIIANASNDDGLWMDSAVHLGNVLHESGSMDKDVKVKRATFIRESTELRETFGFASPAEVLRAVKLYAGSHYGSNLWDLGGDRAGQSVLHIMKNLCQDTHLLC
jgi:hypothetical protein